MLGSNRKKPSLFRRLGGRLYGDAALCALIYIGCANADFGRVRASIWTDGIHAWVGRDAARRAGAPISSFYLTEDEILLRDLAYQLIEPPYDRQRWYSVLGEWGMTHYFKPEWYHCDPTAYAAQMMSSYVRSEATRYYRLNDDIRNDVVRIEPFVAVARRVLDMDSKREKSLAYIPVLSGPEVAQCQGPHRREFPGHRLGAEIAGRPRGILSLRARAAGRRGADARGGRDGAIARAPAVADRGERARDPAAASRSPRPFRLRA